MSTLSPSHTHPDAPSLASPTASTTLASPLERVSAWATRFYLPLLAFVCTAFAWKPLGYGDDFWAHAAVGRWMFEHHQIPRTTLFLWSPSIDWIWHSWGSQAAFYLLMRTFGAQGGPLVAQILTCIASFVTFALLWALWTRHGRITVMTPLLFALAIWIAGARFHPRPETFSALFLAILLVFCAAWPGEMKARTLKALALVGMFALWANLHGGVAMGVVILWATTACDVVQTRGARRSLLLLGVAFSAALAVNLNPWGFAYWKALRPIGGATFHRIHEWLPMWQTPAMPPEALLCVALLGLLPLFAWLQAPRAERRWAHLVWLLIMSAFLVSARRHLWSYAEVCLAMMALHSRPLAAGQLWRVLSPRRPAPVLLRRVTPIIVASGLGIWAINGANPEFWRGQALTDNLPDKTIAKVKAHPNWRLFNDYSLSSYLHWKLDGHPPLYVDLLNAYPAETLDHYFDARDGKPDAFHWLDRSGAQAVLLPLPKDEEYIKNDKGELVPQHDPDREKGQKLYDHLDHSTLWQRVYTNKPESCALWVLRPLAEKISTRH